MDIWSFINTIKPRCYVKVFVYYEIIINTFKLSITHLKFQLFFTGELIEAVVAITVMVRMVILLILNMYTRRGLSTSLLNNHYNSRWRCSLNLSQHIEAETNWPPFYKPHFQTHICVKTSSKFSDICSQESNLQYVSIGLAIAWRRRGHHLNICWPISLTHIRSAGSVCWHG